MHFLMEKFTKFGEQIALIDETSRYSYNQLNQLISDYESKIIELGLLPTEPVALICHSTPAIIALMIALLKNNFIIIAVPGTPRALDTLMDVSEARHLLTLSNDQLELTSYPEKPLNTMYAQIIAANAPGLVLFSSGSSGEPKAIVHNAAALLERFASPKIALRTLMFLSFDHIGGLNTIFYTLSSGGTLIITTTRTPDAICQAIEKNGVELLPTTPSFLNLLLLSELYQKYDLTSLQIISYGTEIMPQITLDRLHNIFPGVKLKQTFGMSETGILPTSSPKDQSTQVKIGGAGFETKIIDDILWIKSDTSMLGYINSPTPFDAEGWFCTRDRVKQNGDYICFLGRESEIINVGGLKVYPTEVENVLMHMPEIENTIVAKQSNPILGNIVVAMVKLKDTSLTTLEIKEKIITFCQDKLEPYKIPQKVIITTENLISERYKKIRIPFK